MIAEFVLDEVVNGLTGDYNELFGLDVEKEDFDTDSNKDQLEPTKMPIQIDRRQRRFASEQASPPSTFY